MSFRICVDACGVYPVVSMKKGVMMLIRLVNPSNCAEFDAYICSAPNGHFMQTSAWGRCRPQWEWQGLMEVDS